VIQMPRRSVTRFFIPLIDVLILLFCIFLLMPFVKSASEEDAAEPSPAGITPTGPEIPADAAELARRLKETEIELERLRKERNEVVERLAIRTLEIDRETGKLYYYFSDGVKLQREEIAGKNDAARMIQRHQDEIRRTGARELMYLVQYPRGPSNYPRQELIDNIRQWFRDVKVGFDNPAVQR